jgi:IS30 family transposase
LGFFATAKVPGQEDIMSKSSGRRTRRVFNAEFVAKRLPPPWTTLHLFKPTPQHLSIGVNLFKSTEPLLSSKLPISHETVYQHVYANKAQGGTLWKNLRCQKQKRKRYAGGRDRRGQIPNRRPLSERPLHIEARRQVGHWECDTVIGTSHKGAVVTMVERKSGYAVMAKVEKKTSELVSSAIVDKLKPMAARVKTLTFDNGKEFAAHAHIDQQLRSTAYFARPFTSWERGSNENLNGLLRQYIPKKRAMSTVSDEEIRMIQNRLNNRPRKRLGFKTPSEVFHESLKRVALRT